MSRLEIIHVRLTDGRPGDLLQDLLRLAPNLTNRSELTIYRRERVASDLSIHIVHQHPAEEIPSPLGVLLASILSERGMVEHSVWTEEKSEEQ